MTILPDHPAGLLAEYPDLLGLESRLGAVLDILRHGNTRCPVSVAIYGDWGTGKTSAMRWLECQLRGWNKLDVSARGEHPCVYPVWFDPWKFQTREDVWRGIIAEVILALFRIETVSRENFVPQMIEAAKKFGSFLGKGFLHALANLDVKIKAPVAGGAEFGIKGQMFREIYDEFDKAVQPQKAYLNQFEETLKNWIQSSLKGGRKQKYPARVALFIDDLDRCSPEVTLEVLEAIKLYLDIEPLLFVVGLDRNVVDAIVAAQFKAKGLSVSKSAQYLDKIFQVEIQVSPSERQMEAFLDDQISALDNAAGRYWSSMLEAAHKQILEDSIKGLAKGNPREIKRLLNSALLHGRAAADNPSLLKGNSEKLVFAQGVQFFLIQRVLRNKLINATRLLLGRSGLMWLQEFSSFVQAHASYIPLRRRGGMGGDEALEKPTERLEEDKEYAWLEERRPNDDEGKPIDLVLLDEPLLWRLLSIQFSMAVAQAAPEFDFNRTALANLSRPGSKAEETDDNVTRLPAVIRNRVAKELDKRVDQITSLDLVGIDELDLSDLQLHEKEFEYITGLSSLQILKLKRTNANDDHVKLVAKLSSLRRLNLGETRITNHALEQVGQIRGLESLHLDDTQIGDEGLKYLAELESLQSLDLSGTEITDSGLAHIAKLSGLLRLRLRDTSIGDLGVQLLANLSRLQVLRLGGTNITDQGLCYLVPLRSIETLELYDTQISDLSLEHLAKFECLESLDLEGTRTTDFGVRHLTNLHKLQELDLSKTQITDSGLQHLATLMSLQTLTLRKTQATPAGIDRLRSGLRSTRIVDS